MIDNNIMDIRKSTIACSIRKRINLYRESGGMAQDREPKVVIGWVPGYKGNIPLYLFYIIYSIINI